MGHPGSVVPMDVFEAIGNHCSMQWSNAETDYDAAYSLEQETVENMKLARSWASQGSHASEPMHGHLLFFLRLISP
jgi:hypothetical protein